MSHEMDSEIVPGIMDGKYMKVTTGYENESKCENENPMLTTSTPVTLTNQNFSEFSGKLIVTYGDVIPKEDFWFVTPPWSTETRG